MIRCNHYGCTVFVLEMIYVWELFFTFFKIGLFTFGGGYAMIAQIREVVVQKKQWLSEEELMEIIAVSESTSSPIAINLATYVGYKRKGFWGSLCATLGVIVPSVVIIYIISLFLDGFMTNRFVSYAFMGIKCAVAFLIIKAGLDMARKMEKKPLPMSMFFICLAALLILELFSVSFSSIVFILGGGLVGLMTYGINANRAEDRK